MSDYEKARLEVESRNGGIIIEITNSTNSIHTVHDPAQALEIAELIAKYAYHAQSGRDDIGRKIMSDVWKAKMLTRVTNVLKRELEKGRKPGFIANNLLDIILSEVT